MSYTHRDNAQFGRARWRKTLLLPCWIAQIVLLLGVMGLFSYRLSATTREWKAAEDKSQAPTVEFVWESINIGFSLISLIVTFVSIARFIAEVMTPLPLLFGNILNLVLSSAVLALDIVVYVQYSDRQYSLTGIAMDCALMFFTIIPTIYAVIIYRRLLSYDDYHLPGNVKPYGYSTADEPEDTAYRSSWLQPPVPYDPTNPSATATRPRSLSASRRISLTLNSRAASPQPTPPPEPVLERRASYDHKRDTQFDDYVRRRSSVLSKDDVDRVLGVEFGWEDNQNQRESVISAGMVSSAVPRPRSDSLNTRQVSLEASISRSGSSSTNTTNSTSTVTLETPGNMVRAHSLNSVPEAHEEEDSNLSLGRTKGGEAREALLGGDRISRSSSGASRTSARRIEPIEGLEEIELDIRKRRRES
ncbi:uncharacterized protein F4822DRAFT_343369 [Hypoxylon trugodes]|uniref:uncharacterized protein n=1 Tax=Hypoxylon trugodes TaxID=326681 RepID=UPI0021972B6B|nr:uncharacterized protein F4822DRAFT_343369 [Hypoxylon trugodes]KAI1385404.1 hypothetical protein F4822DRAFT_343369 [Hypoxylon trugodes]